MIEFLIGLGTITKWHWFTLALIFFSLEALGTGGFLIGAAAAAMFLGVTTWIAPDMSWQAQILLFACTTGIFSVAYWFFFKRFNDETDRPEINNRAEQLIGRIVDLTEPLDVGTGRVQIGDTFWKVRSEAPVAADTKVKVTAVEGMTLLVAPLD